MPLDTGIGLGMAFDGRDISRSRKSLRAVNSRKLICFCSLILLAVAFMYFMMIRNGNGSLSVFKVIQNVYMDSKNEEKQSAPGKNDDYFSIIFDAGSTGTRIHVFHFRKNLEKKLVLLEDVFKQTKPGLSYYADNPELAVESVNNLLKVAKDFIPRERWSNTPISLKATAGLRLLPGNRAQNILEKVRKLFMSTLFQKIGHDFVSIMDGDSEGIYGWLSVNYLSSNLETSSLYGALDLGGGSVQITFALEDKDTVYSGINKEYVKSIEVAKKSYSLYTHSYLGLGLMSARASILNASANTEEGNISNVVHLQSPCFPAGYKGSWKFGSKTFDITGSEQCSFENCHDLAMKMIVSKGINKPDLLKKVNMFAFSYFFDRAVDLGLIDEQTGGQLLVKNYVDAAQTVCQRGSAMEKPFLCLDTTFLSTLMTDGFGLNLHHKLQLKRRINKYDVSWAVGAALHLYEKSQGFR